MRNSIYCLVENSVVLGAVVEIIVLTSRGSRRKEPLLVIELG
ncbi:hypothetical protein ACFL2Q_12660 [Thermodesulfobacteriota bacterium]